MGCGYKMSSGTDYGLPMRGNPIATQFKVLRTHQHGNLWASEIHYPNCDNFEGRKILVTEWNPTSRIALDPHFMDGGGIVARFVPTDYGWNVACEFIERHGA